MSEPLEVVAGERSAEELLQALEEGRRVVVETEMLGATHEVTLRHDEGVYYCDTPTTLHRHETADEMHHCINEYGYGSA
jgi:hypothetical protein